MLLNFVIATVVLNVFLNHCFMFDSVGVMFDRFLSVCCDTSLRAGRYRGALIWEKTWFAACLLWISSAKLHPTSKHKFWGLGASHEIQQSSWVSTGCVTCWALHH